MVEQFTPVVEDLETKRRRQAHAAEMAQLKRELVAEAEHWARQKPTRLRLPILSLAPLTVLAATSVTAAAALEAPVK
jgi:hypothetical protein